MIEARLKHSVVSALLLTAVGSVNQTQSVHAQQKLPATKGHTDAKRHTKKSTPSRPVSSASRASAPARASIPSHLVGTWVWGSVNPGRYVNPTTGAYVGHAGGGAVSHTFAADGTYKRYVLIHFGVGFSNESIFSSMEGKVTFDETAGILRMQLSRGEITFEKKKGMEKRPLSRADMERGGTIFTYSLRKDENGRSVLMINDKDNPASEGRSFYKEDDGAK